ncbi:type IV pilin protein [Neisseriaceae bacterium B1]
MNIRTKQNGFTLIELLVTIIIIAILAAMAYPTYERYIQRSRIENTRATMTKVIHHMEKVYAQRGSFCENNAGNNCQTNFNALLDNSANKYTISMPLLTANRFVLQSVPQNGVYSIDTLGSNHLNIIYDSLTSTFARCNTAGFATATSNNRANGQTTDPGANCETF